MQKIALPAGIKAPGAIWTIVTVVAVSLAHRYVTDPFLIDLGFIVVGLLLPLVIENNADLKKALWAISLLTKRSVPTVDTDMRSAQVTAVYDPALTDLPQAPNALTSYLFG